MTSSSFWRKHSFQVLRSVRQNSLVMIFVHLVSAARGCANGANFLRGSASKSSTVRRVLASAAWGWYAATCTPAGATEAGAMLAAHGNANGAVACATCHGPRGEGNAAAGFPRLAGLGKSYIERQLEAFASGQRQNPIMAPIAKALQPAERTAAANYYAGLPYPGPFARASDAPSTGAVLAQEGRWANGLLPACVQCHGPDGVGVGDAFPPLVGQSASYIAEQLRAWQQGTRPPGPLNLMQAVATKLSPAEVDAVAQYFGGIKRTDATSKEKR